MFQSCKVWTAEILSIYLSFFNPIPARGGGQIDKTNTFM